MATVDIHHHFYPAGRDNEGRPWSVSGSLAEMDRNEVAAAVGSLPPVRGGPAQARAWNEWAAAVCARHPGRFGLFASLPLDHPDNTLAELAHACDALSADGIGLPTNDGDIWLSDDRFLPMYAELDRRRVVVLFHPYPTSRCRDIGTAYGGDLVSPPWLEFPANTARLMLGLMTKGITRRFPRIRFVVCHGGGVMAPLVGRIAGFAGWETVGPDRLAQAFPDGIQAEFARFHFDCAQAYDPAYFAFLRRLVPDTQLLFGSDYSYFPIAHSIRQLAGLDLPPATLSAISGVNAAGLFPRLAGAVSA